MDSQCAFCKYGIVLHFKGKLWDGVNICTTLRVISILRLLKISPPINKLNRGYQNKIFYERKVGLKLLCERMFLNQYRSSKYR
jgi:hypothetical protein